jgi:hypothetical protein
MQVFNSKQKHFINEGKTKQDMLRAVMDDAFFNNPFNENYIISSQPGLGKSYEMMLRKDQAEVLLIEGSSSMAFLTIQVATAVYMANGTPLTIVLDDCDTLFEDNNLNIAKKMFDQTATLQYNKMAKSLKSFCNDIQWEAIESFMSEMDAGFSVPLNNVTFIILTNRHLATANEADAADEGSKKHTRFTDQYAIRRRCSYESIEMNNEDLWGYIANVVLNEEICEKFMPDIEESNKHQILTWMFANWDKVTERNLSLAEKMTKDMVRFTDNYLDVWSKRYLEV